MSRSWKTACLLVLVLGLLLALAGCSANSFGSDPADSSVTDDNAKVLIRGLQEQDFEVTVGELKKLPTVTKHVETTQSNGVKVKVEATGPLLDTFLEQYGKTQKDFNCIRLTAKDDYSITVPSDVLKNREIILSCVNDGKPLKEEWQPLRIIIPGEISKYWVNKMVRIDFETGEAD